MSDSEQEIIELERKYWQAMVDHDIDAALQMTADPCIVAGASGPAVVSHEKYRQMFDAAPWELLEFSLESVEARRVTDDVVLIAYNVTENMVVDGKPLTLKAADTSTWVRQDGRWVNAMHTEAILGDSFGRDRKSTTTGSKPAARKKSAASKRKPQRTVASRRRKVRG